MRATTADHQQALLDSVRRQTRIIAILEAAESAGLTPLPILRLHAFAYLANVLSPTWDLRPLDGKILKRKGGPFYPELQRDVDALVGRGIVMASRVKHVQDGLGNWRLEADYDLNRLLVERLLRYLAASTLESKTVGFIQELAFALSALSDEELDLAVTEDATYSDPFVSSDNVIDFGEWQHVNPSARAARYFETALADVRATPGEQLHLYVRHLHRRMIRAAS